MAAAAAKSGRHSAAVRPSLHFSFTGNTNFAASTTGSRGALSSGKTPVDSCLNCQLRSACLFVQIFPLAQLSDYPGNQFSSFFEFEWRKSRRIDPQREWHIGNPLSWMGLPIHATGCPSSLKENPPPSHPSATGRWRYVRTFCDAVCKRREPLLLQRLMNHPIQRRRHIRAEAHLVEDGGGGGVSLGRFEGDDFCLHQVVQALLEDS
jgi:hypothetical protein